MYAQRRLEFTESRDLQKHRRCRSSDGIFVRLMGHAVGGVIFRL